MFSIFAIPICQSGDDSLHYSTVTYDTLVRAGVKTSSSYVPEITDVLEVAAEHAPAISPPAAKCSRGVNILPDLYFDVGRSGPVGYHLLSFLLNFFVILSFDFSIHFQS